MSTPVRYALLTAGGLILFLTGYTAIALTSGRPLAGMPLVGLFAPEPSALDAETEDAEPDPAATTDGAGAAGAAGTPPSTSRARSVVTASLLDSFVLPSPYSSAELAELQATLQRRLKLAEEEAQANAKRAEELDAWQAKLEERQQQIAVSAGELDQRIKELELRSREITRDESANVEREKRGWRELGKFFQEGDPEDLSARLAGFPAKDAVKILRELDDERASALLNALPADKYRDFLDAYRADVP